MKKIFEIETKHNREWPMLVDRALEKADLITFNVLYTQYENELITFKKNHPLCELSVIEDRIDKFYPAPITISIPLDENCKNQLNGIFEDFFFLENTFLEDPSFWIDDIEILATITHEGLVMIDYDLFADLLLGVKLYDYTP